MSGVRPRRTPTPIHGVPRPEPQYVPLRSLIPSRPGKWRRTRAAGTNLGARIAARDPGDVLTYSLDDWYRCSRRSTSTGLTGQLTTKAALDFEDEGNTDHMFRVTVTATDPFGAPATSVVTITVTDVNEDPTVMGSCLDRPRRERYRMLDINAEDGNGVQPSRIHRHRRGRR